MVTGKGNTPSETHTCLRGMQLVPENWVKPDFASRKRIKNANENHNAVSTETISMWVGTRKHTQEKKKNERLTLAWVESVQHSRRRWVLAAGGNRKNGAEDMMIRGGDWRSMKAEVVVVMAEREMLIVEEGFVLCEIDSTDFVSF